MKTNGASRKGIFWRRIDRFPPILVRLLAVGPNRKALTTMQISAASGLSPAVIEGISQSTDWTGIDLIQFKKFTQSCNLDLTDRDQVHRAEIYLYGKMKNGKRIPPKFNHLENNPEFKTYYQPMAERFWESIRRKALVTVR